MSNIDNQALRERYSEKPAPKCHICGSVMTIQRAGAGGVVYGCTGRIDKDGEGYKFAEGRDFADDHYARSRVTVADESDPDVLALLDELEAKDKSISFLKDQLAQLANFNPDWDKLEAATYSLREHMAELTAARKRIAELEAREVLLPQRYSMLHRVDFDEPYHTEMVYKQHQVLEALHDAGVNVAAAAKGE